MKKVFLLPLLVIAGCASILQGNPQKVALRLDPDVAGQCTITQRNAPVQTVIVPAEVTVSRSYYPMDLVCSSYKPGKTKKVVTTAGQARVYSDVSSLGYTGAVAGVGVGAVVDSGTGDAFDYPNQIIVKLGQTTEIGKNRMNSNVEFKR